MKITQSHIGERCSLKCLRLFKGSDPFDWDIFVIVGVKGDRVMLVVNSNNNRERVFVVKKSHVDLHSLS